MSNYNDAYRSYYIGLKRKVNPSGRVYNTTSVDDLLYRKSKKKKFNLGDIFIKQLVGAIVLLVLAFTIKLIPSKEAQSVYVFSKEIVKTDFNYNEFIGYLKSFDVIEYIKNINIGV